jgi:hypothetical protein
MDARYATEGILCIYAVEGLSCIYAFNGIFCQAMGRPPTEKYEADGGPTSEEILQIL